MDRCFRYLQVNWTAVHLTDDMRHVITPPSKDQASVWIDNDLKYIDPWEPHRIQMLSMVQDYVTGLKQNTDEATGLGILVASLSPILDKTREDNPSASKPKYIIHQANPMDR